MTKQLLNSAFLADAAEIVEQTCNAMREKAKAAILDDPLEFHRWQRAVEEGNMFHAMLRVLSEHEAEQEQASAWPENEVPPVVIADAERLTHITKETV